MSIFIGKQGYDNLKEIQERTAHALAGHQNELNYDGGPFEEKEPAVKWVISELKPTILEIGCGYGRWVPTLKGMYKSYTGIDPCKERVDYATEKYGGKNVEFIHITPGEWDLGKKFDVVLCVTVIQHLLVPDAIVLLKSIEKHLAFHGKAILYESKLEKDTLEECERYYASDRCAFHMVPKPVSLLKEAVPGLVWDNRESMCIVLRHAGVT